MLIYCVKLDHALYSISHGSKCLHTNSLDTQLINLVIIILQQTWTVIPASQIPNHPVARIGHSSISVYDPDADPIHPALLIMWGGPGGGEILRDSWIFHLNQQQWKKVCPEKHQFPQFHLHVSNGHPCPVCVYCTHIP